MSTGVKLWRETEELASFQVGNGNTAMRLCPFALLNSAKAYAPINHLRAASEEVLRDAFGLDRTAEHFF